MRPNCSTGNFIPFGNWTHTLATSTDFTDKGSWEKIWSVPVPSSRIFFMPLHVWILRAAWWQSIFIIWGQRKCQPTKQTERNIHLVSRLRSPSCGPSMSFPEPPLFLRSAHSEFKCSLHSGIYLGRTCHYLTNDMANVFMKHQCWIILYSVCQELDNYVYSFSWIF